MQSLSYIQKQWDVLGQAPFLFLIVLAIAFGAAYAAARWAYQSRLDSAESRLKLRDDRIGDLERKLSELRQAAESTAPKVEAHGNETDDYSAVIRRLISRYIFEFKMIDPDILSGRELPPLSWMNHQLDLMDKDWRITGARGPIAEIGPA